MTMNSFDEESSASSTSPSFSSSTSSDDHFLSSAHNNGNECYSPSPAPSPQQHGGIGGGGAYVKRKAGRKKFRETRHPVYRGVRERNGGKWVCEVREPHKKTRIWLGTYLTPEMAARAHDVAAVALRGKSAPLNFADSAWVLPHASSSAAKDIRAAAVQAAAMFRPLAGSPGSPSSSSFPSPSPSQRQRRKAISPMSSSSVAAATAMMPAAAAVSFVDEEALFNMPALLQSMAEGMLLAPPTMSMVVPQQQQYHHVVDWDDVDDDGALHMDLSLWSH